MQSTAAEAQRQTRNSQIGKLGWTARSDQKVCVDSVREACVASRSEELPQIEEERTIANLAAYLHALPPASSRQRAHSRKSPQTPICAPYHRLCGCHNTVAASPRCTQRQRALPCGRHAHRPVGGRRRDKIPMPFLLTLDSISPRFVALPPPAQAA